MDRLGHLGQRYTAGTILRPLTMSRRTAFCEPVGPPASTGSTGASAASFSGQAMHVVSRKRSSVLLRLDLIAQI